ncbi:RiPP maturation radical SAM C-methyltransferase [Streptomyces sp. ZYX-F-203]
MRVILVHMPWGALDVPSLALGILHTVAAEHGHDVDVRYANLEFAEWTAERAGFDLDAYTYFSEKSYFQGVGDWAFAGALYGDDPSDDGKGPDPVGFADYFRFLAANGARERERGLARAARALAPGFVRHLVDELSEDPPDLVGFTTTFQQNTASLAAARLLKEACPDVRIVFGGANCDGPQGAALHRNFPFLDFVVRGEGERAFPAVLGALGDPPAAGRGAPDLSDVPGLCWRESSGASAVNAIAARPLPPAAIRSPDYDAFYETFDASAVADWVEPKLVVEGSRGCWWGEKHHCAFCGLNGTSMAFRSKEPEVFLAEVLRLSERHRILDVQVVDNILDMRYFDTVLRTLAGLPVDLRLHFEVKSNLRREHFRLLAESGAVQVQPGIESLSTRVLRLMDKGVTGCQNVRALRDAQSAGVTVAWNHLYGFPGETVEDYEPVIRQLPLLHHLEPPTGAGRIVVERFSPYHDRPELGFDITRPAFQYGETYRLPPGELADLAYVFTAAPRGIGPDPADALGKAVERWREEYPTSRLTFHDTGDRILLVNTRKDYRWDAVEISDPVESALFRLLHRPRSAAALAREVPGGSRTVAPVIDRWTDRGLLFHDDGSWVQVAVESDNQMLMRVEHRHDFARQGEAHHALVSG